MIKQESGRSISYHNFQGDLVLANCPIERSQTWSGRGLGHLRHFLPPLTSLAAVSSKRLYFREPFLSFVSVVWRTGRAWAGILGLSPSTTPSEYLTLLRSDDPLGSVMLRQFPPQQGQELLVARDLLLIFFCVWELLVSSTKSELYPKTGLPNVKPLVLLP